MSGRIMHLIGGSLFSDSYFLIIIYILYLQKYIYFFLLQFGRLTFFIYSKSIYICSFFLKFNSILPVTSLMDICVVDYPLFYNRFYLIYCF